MTKYTKDWQAHERRRLERERREIAKRVAQFDKLDTATLVEKMNGSPTPWERAALRYVLGGRETPTEGSLS